MHDCHRYIGECLTAANVLRFDQWRHAHISGATILVIARNMLENEWVIGVPTDDLENPGQELFYRGDDEQTARQVYASMKKVLIGRKEEDDGSSSASSSDDTSTSSTSVAHG